METLRTVKDVQRELDRIRESIGDPEGAHGLEDELWVAVLKTITDGTSKNPQEMARLALTSTEIEFPRRYA